MARLSEQAALGISITNSKVSLYPSEALALLISQVYVAPPASCYQTRPTSSTRHTRPLPPPSHPRFLPRPMPPPACRPRSRLPLLTPHPVSPIQPSPSVKARGTGGPPSPLNSIAQSQSRAMTAGRRTSTSGGLAKDPENPVASRKVQKGRRCSLGWSARPLWPDRRMTMTAAHRRATSISCCN